MEYGTSKGLAYRHDWNQQQRQALLEEEADRRAEQDALNQANYWGDKLKFGQAFTQHGQQQLKGFTNETLTNLGKVINSNVNWQYNPGVRMQVMSMMDSLSNNPIVHRELTTKQEKERMLKDLASGELPIQFYEENLRKYENINKTGNSMGIAGQDEEFLYVKPERVDFNKELKGVYDMYEDETRVKDYGPYAAIVSYKTPEQFRSMVDVVKRSDKNLAMRNTFKVMQETQQIPDNMTYDDFLYQTFESLSTIRQADFKFNPNYDNGKTSSSSSSSSGSGNSNKYVDYFPNFVEQVKDPKVTGFPDRGAVALMPIGPKGTMVLNEGLTLMSTNTNPKTGKRPIFNLPSFRNIEVEPKYSGRVEKGVSGIPYGVYTAKAPVGPIWAEVFEGENVWDGDSFWEDVKKPEDIDNYVKPKWKGAFKFEFEKGEPTKNIQFTGMAPLKEYNPQNTLDYNLHWNTKEGIAEIQNEFDRQRVQRRLVDTGIEGYKIDPETRVIYDTEGNVVKLPE